MPNGTRFRLFSQHPALSTANGPETVWLSSPPGTIGPGPSDDRMYTIRPLGAKRPYGTGFTPYGRPVLYFPPWMGAVGAPAMPGDDGHFDHLPPDTPEFELAHLFGCVRFSLDIWERYFGRPIPWHFAARFDRLELAPLRDFDNAQAGYGYIEMGERVLPEGRTVVFSLNFDIIAHELGHLIIYQEVGQPTAATAGGEYYGFHESAADLVGILACAHLDSVIDPLLANTRGNLYVLNRLNRIGEVSDNDQIRLASNSVRLSAFRDGWSEEHDLSLPLTGAMFDILVDIFHENLLEQKLISPELEDLADQVERLPQYDTLIQTLFDQAYMRNAEGFRLALLEARDTLGSCLTATWQRLSPQSLTYVDVANALLEVDRERSNGRYARLIRRNLWLRDIGRVTVGPRLRPPGADSHAYSARTISPELAVGLPPMSYRERWLLARESRESLTGCSRRHGIS